jgi:hypothetical protein
MYGLARRLLMVVVGCLTLALGFEPLLATPTPVVPTPTAAGCDDMPQYVEDRIAHYEGFLDRFRELLGLPPTSTDDEILENVFSMSIDETADLVQLYSDAADELELMDVPRSLPTITSKQFSDTELERTYSRTHRQWGS